MFKIRISSKKMEPVSEMKSMSISIWLACIGCIIFLFCKFISIFTFARVTKTKRRHVSEQETVSEKSLRSNDQISGLRVGKKSLPSHPDIACAIKSFQFNSTASSIDQRSIRNDSFQVSRISNDTNYTNRFNSASDKHSENNTKQSIDLPAHHRTVRVAASTQQIRVLAPFEQRVPTGTRRSKLDAVRALPQSIVDRNQDISSEIEYIENSSSNPFSTPAFLAQPNLKDNYTGSMPRTFDENREKAIVMLTSEPPRAGCIDYSFTSSSVLPDQEPSNWSHTNVMPPSKRKHDIELEPEYKKHFRPLQANVTTVLLDDTLFSVQYDKSPLPVHVSADPFISAPRVSADVKSQMIQPASFPSTSENGGLVLHLNPAIPSASDPTNSAVSHNYAEHQNNHTRGREMKARDIAPANGPSSSLLKSSSESTASLPANSGFGTNGIASVCSSNFGAPDVNKPTSATVPGALGDSRAASENSKSSGSFAVPSFAFASTRSGTTSTGSSESAGSTVLVSSTASSFGSAKSSESAPSTVAVSTSFSTQEPSSSVPAAPSFSFGISSSSTGVTTGSNSSTAVSFSIPSLGLGNPHTTASNALGISFGTLGPTFGVSDCMGATAGFGGAAPAFGASASAAPAFGASASAQLATPFGVVPSFGAQSAFPSAKEGSGTRQSGRGAGRGRGRR